MADMTPIHPTQASVGEVTYPELPYTSHFKALGPGELFTADQMRSYADATCALRGAQKESGPTASEAVFAFAAWLTCRPERVTLSSCDDASVAVQLVNAFIASQGWAPPRENYHELLKPYPSAPTPEGEAK